MCVMADSASASILTQVHEHLKILCSTPPSAEEPEEGEGNAVQANDNDKLLVPTPDTWLFKAGTPVMWFGSDKIGHVGMRKKKVFSDEDILSVLRDRMFGADDSEESSTSAVEDDRFICVLRSRVKNKLVVEFLNYGTLVAVLKKRAARLHIISIQQYVPASFRRGASFLVFQNTFTRDIASGNLKFSTVQLLSSNLRPPAVKSPSKSSSSSSSDNNHAGSAGSPSSRRTKVPGKQSPKRSVVNRLHSISDLETAAATMDLTNAGDSSAVAFDPDRQTYLKSAETTSHSVNPRTKKHISAFTSRVVRYIQAQQVLEIGVLVAEFVQCDGGDPILTHLSRCDVVKDKGFTPIHTMGLTEPTGDEPATSPTRRGRSKAAPHQQETESSYQGQRIEDLRYRQSLRKPKLNMSPKKTRTRDKKPILKESKGGDSDDDEDGEGKTNEHLGISFSMPELPTLDRDVLADDFVLKRVRLLLLGPKRDQMSRQPRCWGEMCNAMGPKFTDTTPAGKAVLRSILFAAIEGMEIVPKEPDWKPSNYLGGDGDSNGSESGLVDPNSANAENTSMQFSVVAKSAPHLARLATVDNLVRIFRVDYARCYELVPVCAVCAEAYAFVDRLRDEGGPGWQAVQTQDMLQHADAAPPSREKKRAVQYDEDDEFGILSPPPPLKPVREPPSQKIKTYLVRKPMAKEAQTETLPVRYRTGDPRLNIKQLTKDARGIPLASFRHKVRSTAAVAKMERQKASRNAPKLVRAGSQFLPVPSALDGSLRQSRSSSRNPISLDAMKHNAQEASGRALGSDSGGSMAPPLESPQARSLGVADQ